MNSLPSDLPPPKYGDNEFFQLLIPDDIHRLNRLLGAIGKWRALAEAEFRTLQTETDSSKASPGDEYGYDPIADEAFLTLATERALFGSLAVAIATIAETWVGQLCRARKITFVDSKGKPIVKPNWGHKKAALEKELGVTFEGMAGFPDNKRARLLGNCFKHHEGKVDADCAKHLSLKEEEEIEYEKQDWHAMIDGTRAFLLDLAGKM